MTKIIFAITIISAALFCGCGSPATNANSASNVANYINANTINSPVDNNLNANNAASKSTSPDPHAANVNTENRPKSNANANPIKKQKTDSLVDNVNKRADVIVNTQNGSVKKLKKNVDKLIKDLP
jgi:hypothetical protein